MAYRSGFPFGPVAVPGMFNLRREIDRLFDDAFGGQNPQGGATGGARTTQSYTPAVDAREDQHEITLHVDLPGVRPEDVDISVEEGLLTIRGQRHQHRKEGQEGRYQFVERSYGSFARAFHLPQGVDESQIRAEFEHGELIVHVPKPAVPQPRKIQIGVGGVNRQGSMSSGAQGGQPAMSSGQGTTGQGTNGQGTTGQSTSAHGSTGQGASGNGRGELAGAGAQR